MTRTASPLSLLVGLLLGILLGTAIDRGGHSLSAQATGGPPSDSAAAPPVAQLPQPKVVGEDALYQELTRQYEQFLPVNRTFELVAKVVSPAVVHIVARKSGTRDDDRTPFRFEETGSGVIVRPERGKGLYVLTNNHVVDGATSADINIVLHDGRVLHPLRSWSDTKADIAVLRLGRDDLPAARLGNSDEAAVGSWVLALGSPFGLTHSVSQGIISARGRHEDELKEDGVENQDFLQTDAAINPGNSGGPLVNMKGEIIGINTAIASNGGGNEGVGFSIPSNLAKWIMSQLVASGKVSRGAMGVQLHEDFKHDEAMALGLDRPKGAWIKAVTQSSPAAEAGFRDGDVIVRFNGVDVVNLNHLINLVSMTPVGSTADVVLWRDHKEVGKKVRIADQDTLLAQVPTSTLERQASNSLLRRPPRPQVPVADPAAAAEHVLGLELAALDGPTARRLGLAENLHGVVVLKVDPTSPLAAYCKPLDVIGTVDGQAVHTASEAVQALSRPAGRNPVELGLQRMVNGAMQWRKIRVPR